MTIAQALALSTEQLQDCGDSPRLDAEILLAFAVKRNRTHLLTHHNDTLTTSQYSRFRRLVQKRRRHTPVSYLTGRCDFFGLPLRVTPAVLVPRPFTELLVEAMLRHLPLDSTATILDVGTGSGAIAITLASQRPNARIIGTDVSTAALRIARDNARRLGLMKRITWRRGSLLEPLHPADAPQVIISNLPYLTRRQLREPSIRREPKIALNGGRRGLTFIYRLLKQISNFPSVKLLSLECDPTQVVTIISLLKLWVPLASIERIRDGKKTRGLIAY